MMANIVTPFAADEGVSRANFNSRINEINTAIDYFDCGFFDDADAVSAHNTALSAHTAMSIDCNVSECGSSATTLEEHMVDENAHQNLVIDGNDC